MPNSLLLRSSPPATVPLFPAAARFPRAAHTGVFSPWKSMPKSFTFILHCNAISKAPAEAGFVDVFQNGLSAITWHKDMVHDDTEKDKYKEELKSDRRRHRMVEMIRSMLKSMDDGEITISPYDTAWVALVEDIDGSGQPQFPSSLDWISNNQLADGSWGDRTTFSAHDRILNTLACVVALRSWKMHPDKSDKGISFIRENIRRLGHENQEHMPIGFEVALPSLIETAKKLGIDVPNDSLALQDIYARRELKLTRIPKDIMHKVPTTLLHSLEGMSGLDWQKLLKLQCADGSFLFSPSSTAFALQQTKDEKCLKYLLKHVRKFNGGVPNVYPVDLFERLWVVDRLQRLGISRYFQHEIKDCIDYVHRYWTDKGICWARNSRVQDIDDTAMGFRLLRLQGYQVSADVFNHFKSGTKFFCFAGQSNQAVTGMYNLYRASQVMFPGEDILAEANIFAVKFLQEKRANNELFDKWIITKDLAGEVGYALDVPWYASLPRIETRFFLEQYGGEGDVWIGKTLYRMPYVNNEAHLELARLDYNNCQALHQNEWTSIKQWYRNCRLGEFQVSETSPLRAYYIAAASIYAPENSQQRLAWAKTAILMETVVSHFDERQLTKKQKQAFLNEFEHGNILKYGNGRRYEIRDNLVGTLIRTVSELSLDTLLAHGIDIHQQLYHAWQKWLRTREGGGTNNIGEGDAELLVCTLNLSSGGRRNRGASDELLPSHPKHQRLLQITSNVCHHLRLFQNQKVTMADIRGAVTAQIEKDMQELVKLVHTKCPGDDDLDWNIKQNFLVIARSLYYSAYCNPGSMNFHIAKVLFERVNCGDIDYLS